MTSDFSTETFQDRRERCEIFKVMKSKDLQPRLLYPARLSFKIKGETRSFPDKKKLKEFIKTSVVTNVKGLALRRRRRRRRRRKTKTRGKQSNNKMALHTYLSIITLNATGLDALTKIQRVAEWLRKQDPYICCLQETHLRIKVT